MPALRAPVGDNTKCSYGVRNRLLIRSIHSLKRRCSSPGIKSIRRCLSVDGPLREINPGLRLKTETLSSSQTANVISPKLDTTALLDLCYPGRAAAGRTYFGNALGGAAPGPLCWGTCHPPDTLAPWGASAPQTPGRVGRPPGRIGRSPGPS